MPLFYFDISNGTVEPDEVGTLLAGAEDARTQAVKLVGEMLRFDPRPVWDGQGLMIEVFDEVRNPLFRIKVDADTPFPPS